MVRALLFAPMQHVDAQLGAQAAASIRGINLHGGITEPGAPIVGGGDGAPSDGDGAAITVNELAEAHGSVNAGAQQIEGVFGERGAAEMVKVQPILGGLDVETEPHLRCLGEVVEGACHHADLWAVVPCRALA